MRFRFHPCKTRKWLIDIGADSFGQSQVVIGLMADRPRRCRFRNELIQEKVPPGSVIAHAQEDPGKPNFEPGARRVRHKNCHVKTTSNYFSNTKDRLVGCNGDNFMLPRSVKASNRTPQRAKTSKFSCPAYIGSSRLDASADSQACRSYCTVADFMTKVPADGVHGYGADPQGRLFVARDSVGQVFILISSCGD